MKEQDPRETFDPSLLLWLLGIVAILLLVVMP